MKMETSRICYIDIPSGPGSNRSLSPMTPSPRFERNLGFFHALSRRFGLRSHDDLIYHGEDDSRSSSTDSCSSTTGALPSPVPTKDVHGSNMELSCASSDCSSTVDDSEKTVRSTSRLHRRSTSSIRRAFENMSISSRSLSCSGTSSKESHQKPTKKTTTKPPQRILRQPVTYTYLKGMSGLPTQRVPRSAVCCHYAHR
ncbi:uncharacterized protein LOC129910850 [Episyrphus balteatus]|uniref:uncharacterized protein LOC129910850 n=1 Tax=Episyrphus balteatus TaxID=286459 RepID=UPI002484F795|nr:uncharacterized protein LOC129910850 [Episyrphus balteatus]